MKCKDLNLLNINSQAYIELVINNRTYLCILLILKLYSSLKTNKRHTLQQNKLLTTKSQNTSQMSKSISNIIKIHFLGQRNISYIDIKKFIQSYSQMKKIQ